jgi:arylsulfatase A-like enzyme
LTERLTEEAVKLIRNSKDRPFFLYFPFYAVHTPLQGKADKIRRYEAVPKNDQQGKAAYAAMVESVDDGVGRIMKLLTELSLKENTLVIFTSDNGGFAGATSNAPLRANKGSHYEGGIRVPLIISGPGVSNPGRVNPTPVITNDLYPTILEMATLLERPHQHVDGVSLAPLLKGDESIKRDSLFWHYPHYNKHPHSAPVSIVRRGPWKLIEFLESSQTELYHLTDDLSEANNLTESQPHLARELLTELHAWKEHVGADSMLPNPNFMEGQALK